MKRNYNISFTACTVLAMLIVPFFVACGQRIKGSGNVITETRELSSFNAIDVGGAFAIELIQGNTEGITLEADDNIMPKIVTKIDKGTLKIDLKGNVQNYKKLKAIVKYKELEKVEASGAVSIIQNEKSKHSKLAFDLSGASKVRANLSVESLSIESSGAAEIDLKGEADNFNLDVSGAGEVNALKLQSKNCKVEISGAGNADVYSTEKLDVSISGAGSVRYKGTPQINKEVSGAGSVKKLNDK